MTWNQDEGCDPRCMASTGNTCTCRCRGENHGTENRRPMHVQWRERNPETRKPSLRQEAKAGQIFMFPELIKPKERRGGRRQVRAAAHRRAAEG